MNKELLLKRYLLLSLSYLIFFPVKGITIEPLVERNPQSTFVQRLKNSLEDQFDKAYDKAELIYEKLEPYFTLKNAIRTGIGVTILALAVFIPKKVKEIKRLPYVYDGYQGQGLSVNQISVESQPDSVSCGYFATDYGVRIMKAKKEGGDVDAAFKKLTNKRFNKEHTHKQVSTWKKELNQARNRQVKIVLNAQLPHGTQEDNNFTYLDMLDISDLIDRCKGSGLLTPQDNMIVISSPTEFDAATCKTPQSLGLLQQKIAQLQTEGTHGLILRPVNFDHWFALVIHRTQDGVEYLPVDSYDNMHRVYDPVVWKVIETIENVAVAQAYKEQYDHYHAAWYKKLYNKAKRAI